MGPAVAKKLLQLTIKNMRTHTLAQKRSEQRTCGLPCTGQRAITHACIPVRHSCPEAAKEVLLSLERLACLLTFLPRGLGCGDLWLGCSDLKLDCKEMWLDCKDLRLDCKEMWLDCKDLGSDCKLFWETTRSRGCVGWGCSCRSICSSSSACAKLGLQQEHEHVAA
eukprot:456245-Pelagomonas_calceolata.AAC.1